MSDTVHNWDIDTLKLMITEINRIIETLSGNITLLEQKGFELMTEWQGKAGKKIMLKTIANTGDIGALIKRYENLKNQLNDVVTKCYEPCEAELKSKASNLLYCR